MKLQNLTAELLKYGADAIVPLLCDKLQRWLSGKIPREWKEGEIVAIPKKVDLSKCSNWSGITLFNSIEKVLALIIADRISPA